MKAVLVTGGAGFIGSNFVRHLLNLNDNLRIITLDALTYAGSLKNLEGLSDPSRHSFVNGSINDFELVQSILQNDRVSLVVNFAAESHVDRSIVGPGAFIETNILGTYQLLEACRSVWKSEAADAEGNKGHFHHISTDEVYGSLEPEDAPFSESTPYAPNSPYAASKASSDHLVRAYHRTYGLRTTITNCSNNYGPYQFPEKLIPVVIFNALRGLPLPIYGDGMQIRDWLHVHDHCDAIWRVIRTGTAGSTYNVGGDEEVTNLRLVRAICTILDQRFSNSPHCPHADLIKFVTDRPGHDRRYAVDSRVLHEHTGWTPATPLSKGLKETVDWYLDHTEWMDSVTNTTVFGQWMHDNYGDRSSS